MIGILHCPEQPGHRGVLIVVGGPQYRVGSHRQFLLLARFLADAGIAVLRFDYRGMGDSDGEPRCFEDIRDDIAAAVDEFFARIPELREVVIWGLCDAASAALMYACNDSRIRGLVLLNPWVRSDATLARAFLKHHYAAKFFDKDFWKRILTGQTNPFMAIADFLATLRDASRGEADQTAAPDTTAFVDRMRDGLARFTGRVLVILSGEDITAAEFKDEVARSARWRELVRQPRVKLIDFESANHTFSRRVWRDRVAADTAEWIKSL